MTLSVAATSSGTLISSLSLPHELSRQPSKEDLELAANLNLLNNSEGRRPSTTEVVNKRKSDSRRELSNSTQDDVVRERRKGQKRRELDAPATTTATAKAVTTTAAASSSSPKEGSPAVQSVASLSLREEGQNVLTTPIAGQTCRLVSELYHWGGGDYAASMSIDTG